MLPPGEGSADNEGPQDLCVTAEATAVSTRREREAVTEEEAEGGSGKTGRPSAGEEAGVINNDGCGKSATAAVGNWWLHRLRHRIKRGEAMVLPSTTDTEGESSGGRQLSVAAEEEKDCSKAIALIP
ncbi:hypothetical protein B296_00015562 [Ensete ventricosum]|uniref:Uncharacterized protein n=1 Tax=Ensete ventricosum TaxID=4639 RepID=A0A426ZCC0_ENSVE|nr:hypothetical protein B296_00015562 [Ensete ventricosum]